MRIYIAPPRHDHARKWQTAFQNGLSRHGVEITDAERCDVAVMWGHRSTDLIDAIRSTDRHYVVMECGYLGDHLAWCSLGIDGLNGRATFPEISEPERFRKHFAHLMQPWRRPEGYALIMGQVTGDAAIAGINIALWYDRVASALMGAGWDVVFRSHPLEIAPQPPRASLCGRVSGDGPLSDALEGAGLVVSYNSNSGVDAVLAGVPTVAFDHGSMAWPVAAHDLDTPVYMPCREEWATRLAWKQWTIEEIASGEAWERLSPILRVSNGVE